jgi:hypothetical protein
MSLKERTKGGMLYEAAVLFKYCATYLYYWINCEFGD